VAWSGKKLGFLNRRFGRRREEKIRVHSGCGICTKVTLISSGSPSHYLSERYLSERLLDK
jgi:hypothetical protein